MRQPPRYVGIIEAYLAGTLSLPDAARQLLDALADSGPVNLWVSPRMRPLFAEVERLRSGGSATLEGFAGPDPRRHENGNLDLLDYTAEHFWSTLAKYDHPTRLDCSFHALTKEDADRIRGWLEGAGHTVGVQSPAEADADDWVVRGTSPTQQWTRALLEDWVALLRSAPLDGTASIHGAGVRR